MSIRKSEINIPHANLLGLVFLAVVVAVLVPLFNWLWPKKGWESLTTILDVATDQIVHGMSLIEETLPSVPIFVFGVTGGSIFGIGAVVVIFVLLMIPHEFLHGLTWKLASKGSWQDIKFGIMWKKLCTPYCHCGKPMQVRHFRLVLLMPLCVLGILPCMLSLCIGSPVLLAYGIVGIVAASGDIWMTWLLRNEDANTRIYDHPSAAGFFLFDTDEDFEEIKKELN